MAKQIIQDRKIIASNWLYISSDEFDATALPSSNLLLNYPLWQEQNTQLTNTCAPVIVGSIELADIASQLITQADIGLYFANLKDGTGYSYARMLREDYNYKGNLHALGTVEYDHLCFMERCGINVFHLNAASNLQSALEYFADIEVTYQR
jgi:uncharacterized protein (DUF934 family)